MKNIKKDDPRREPLPRYGNGSVWPEVLIVAVTVVVLAVRLVIGR